MGAPARVAVGFAMLVRNAVTGAERVNERAAEVRTWADCARARCCARVVR